VGTTRTYRLLLHPRQPSPVDTSIPGMHGAQKKSTTRHSLQLTRLILARLAQASRRCTTTANFPALSSTLPEEKKKRVRSSKRGVLVDAILTRRPLSTCLRSEDKAAASYHFPKRERVHRIEFEKEGPFSSRKKKLGVTSTV